jgi:hypothetical protein
VVHLETEVDERGWTVEMAIPRTPHRSGGSTSCAEFVDAMRIRIGRHWRGSIGFIRCRGRACLRVCEICGRDAT